MKKGTRFFAEHVYKLGGGQSDEGAVPPPSSVPAPPLPCQHLLLPTELVGSGLGGLGALGEGEAWCALPLPLSSLPLSMPLPLSLPLPLAAMHLRAPATHFFTDCRTAFTGSGAIHVPGGGEQRGRGLGGCNSAADRGGFSSGGERGGRGRGEKRPIPEEHKDDKYYERRKRNNQAAKKSRDARKFREDQIALRAMLLEQENRLLRAQLAALRDEARSLLLQ